MSKDYVTPMNDLVKVTILLPDGPVAAESLWTVRTDVPEIYQLRNIPFYALGYAEGDLVRCIVTADGLQVTALAQNSGNGTLRIYFAQSQSDAAQRVLDELTSVGCTYERASERLVGVTVPPALAIPFSQLANYLNDVDEQTLIAWEVAKPMA